MDPRAVFDFEDVGKDLALLPLSARRALDIAGFRLSLDGWKSLTLADRRAICSEGAREAVDASVIEQVVRLSQMPATRIRPVPDPDPLAPPEQLNLALGARRAIEPARWAKLRALERYALIHVLRRSVAHDDPLRLEIAVDAIVPPKTESRPPTRREDERARPRRSISSIPPRAQAFDIPLQRPRATENTSDPGRAPRGREDESPSGRTAAEGLSNHLSSSGEVHMVDVGQKRTSLRRARAMGSVVMRPETAMRLSRAETPKGEVLSVARVAGIMAAKRTPELIPLCHSVRLTHVEIHIDVDEETGTVNVTAVVDAEDRTGVEMEALTGVSVACLTIYDMLKGIDRDMVIGDLRLLSKSGGKSDYERDV